MTLTAIIGGLGSGKTLLMTYLGYHMSRTIYSNYKLNFTNYRALDLLDLLNLPNNINVFLDELTAWLDSRVSAKATNRYLSYIFLQSRKMNTDIYATCQLFGSVDLRFRELSDVIIECEAVNEMKYNDMIVPEFFVYRIYDRNKGSFSVKKLMYSDALPIFEMYNTYEIVEPIDKNELEAEIIKRDSRLLKKKLREIINQIDDDVIEPTKDVIESALQLHNIPRKYFKFVYNVLNGKLKLEV